MKNEKTLADHAEEWYKENGHVIPARNTNEWDNMYKKWFEFAFKGIGKCEN